MTNPARSIPLVANPNNVRLAMLGMIEGNGHPYSWSAIINGGFSAEAMAKCPYPVIHEYLSAQPREALGISGARVTHIWCDDPLDADRVAAASLIPNVVRGEPTSVIGHVDAVIIPTDDGSQHVDRARPFIDAGIPVFIDKPLVDREDHLREFVAWDLQGRAFMSSSCMRYASEFRSLRPFPHELGDIRAITISMCKSWERYGIHALEAVYPLLAPGEWRSVLNTGGENSNIVSIKHASGVDVVVLQAGDLYGAFGCLTLYGTKAVVNASFKDTFWAFKSQLVDFIRYLRNGTRPFEFAETVELMKLLIAARQSRERSGSRIFLRDLHTG